MGFIVGKGFIVPCASPQKKIAMAAQLNSPFIDHSLQVVWPHDITYLPFAYHVALMGDGRKFVYACAFEFECVLPRFLRHVKLYD